MASEKFERPGACKAPLTGSVWKQGHSIKCERREASAVRYWHPDKARYRYAKYWPDLYDGIDAEIFDFCSYCPFREQPYKLEVKA